MFSNYSLCSRRAVCITVEFMANKQVTAMMFTSALHRMILLYNFCDFVTSSTVHLRSPHEHTSAYFLGFSLSVHHHLLTKTAA
jgi:hypothetical protein